MTQEQHHPITPPNELVQQWMEEAHDQPPGPDVRVIATRAAQWGADQRGAVNEAKLQKARDEELKACCLLLDDGEHAASYGCHNGSSLRAARRPKPPSLKEQALEALETLNQAWTMPKELDAVIAIRRALEALND
jgi:hypothetical protein